MIDVLAVGAHPDDIAIFMGGTMGVLKSNGYKTGICYLTKGESGTYGNAETRMKELSAAGKVLEVDDYTVLDIPDGAVTDSEENRIKLIDVIRLYKPRIVFSFITGDTRHPDHQQTGMLVQRSIFLSGLKKIETGEAPHRPETLIQFPEIVFFDKPDLVIDVSEFREKKLEAIRAYSSQVLTEEQKEDTDSQSFFKKKRFWKILETRSRQAGAMIGTEFGEPFYMQGPVKISGELKLF